MKGYDKPIAWAAAFLTVLLIILMITNSRFFEWTFERHQNQWSWYIRPLFILPFCYFSYKHRWSGISVTILGLLTSMFWFNKPDVVTDEVKTFLQFEKDWIQSDWEVSKVILVLTVPVSMTLLALAFWMRSLWMGMAVVVLMATGKIIWSVYNAGEAGKSILIPAMVGLFICTGILFLGFRRLEKRNASR